MWIEQLPTDTLTIMVSYLDGQGVANIETVALRALRKLCRRPVVWKALDDATPTRRSRAQTPKARVLRYEHAASKAIEYEKEMKQRIKMKGAFPSFDLNVESLQPRRSGLYEYFVRISEAGKLTWHGFLNASCSEINGVSALRLKLGEGKRGPLAAWKSLREITRSASTHSIVHATLFDTLCITVVAVHNETGESSLVASSVTPDLNVSRSFYNTYQHRMIEFTPLYHMCGTVTPENENAWTECVSRKLVFALKFEDDELEGVDGHVSKFIVKEYTTDHG